MAKIQLRRASTSAQWQASSVVLDAGEPGVALDTGEIRIGNGNDIWANLPVRSGGGTSDWNGIVNKPITFPPTVGTTSTTAAAGNDARLSDARTPKDNSVLNVHVASNAAISADKIADGNTNKVYTVTEKGKLAGIQSGATANASDSSLRDRTTHTGVVPVGGLGTGTPGSGKYVDGATGAWTVLPTGGGTGATSLANVPAGYTHTISYATATAATNRANITGRTDIIIRIYGGTDSDIDPAWMIDGDYRDLVPSG